MPPFLTSPQVAPILLLIASNVFMTFAWYGYLAPLVPLLIAIVAYGASPSWYCLAVPRTDLGAPSIRRSN